MAKIILTSDSTSDLSLELKEKVNLHVVPLIVNIEGKEHKDGADIDSDYIYDSVARTGVLPKTAALSIGEFTEFFNSVRESEDDIILHFSISSGFSSSYQNSVLAASDMKNVYAFDSFNLSTGIGLQILEADRLIKEGLDIEDIIMRLQDYKERVDASFIIDKLDYLQKGGRCSAVTGLVANLLHLKPCIEVIDGKMGVTVSGVSKKVNPETGIPIAVEELKSLENFRDGMIWHESAGSLSVYNDDDNFYYKVDDERGVMITPNIAILPNTYQMGFSKDYTALLQDVVLYGEYVDRRN